MNIASTEPQITLVNSAVFAEQKYAKKWLVTDVLVAGQPCVIGGAIKTMKTSVTIDLAISLGTATPFLAHFHVPHKKRVAVFSGESGERTVQETARRICRSKQQSLDANCHVHWGFHLPRLGSASDLRELGNVLKTNRIEVVIIDPLYLCLLAGSKTASASNLFDVGALLMRVSETCSQAGSTMVLIHHMTKGTSNKKGAASTLADLAFAGIGEFARQWLLLTRTVEFTPGSGIHNLQMSLGGSAGHASRWLVHINESFIDEKRVERGWDVDVGCISRQPGRRADSKLEFVVS